MGYNPYLMLLIVWAAVMFMVYFIPVIKAYRQCVKSSSRAPSFFAWYRTQLNLSLHGQAGAVNIGGTLMLGIW